jgi:hypothetical protein
MSRRHAARAGAPVVEADHHLRPGRVVPGHGDHTAQAPSAPYRRSPGIGSERSVLALQRHVGNAAVADVVARLTSGAPTAPTVARSVTDEVTSMTVTAEYAQSLTDAELQAAVSSLGERLQAETDPALLSVVQENLRVLNGEHLPRRVESANLTAGAAAEMARVAITETQRMELRRITGDRIIAALVEYATACERVKSSLTAAAAANAEMVALVIDVGTGFLAPALGRGIARLASALPVHASTAAYRVAIAGLDTDMVTTLFTEATKVGNQLIKSHATVLFGETDVDLFVSGLVSATRRGFGAINEGLPALADAELGVVCAAFDPSVSNVDVYTEAIRDLVGRFQREVLPIGTVPLSFGEMPSNVSPPSLAYIRHGGRRRPALVEYRAGFLPFTGDYWFRTWVSPDMEALAKARQGSSPVEELEAADVRMLRE